MMEAALELTRVCNLACVTCHKVGPPDPAELREDEWLDVLGMLRAEGFVHLRVTGGEPLASPHLLPVLRRARQLGFESTVVETNGTLLDDVGPGRIAAEGATLRISLYATRPATHDAITRVPGSHAAAVTGLESAVAAGASVTVHAHLLRSNLEELPHLQRWCAERGLTLSSSMMTFPKADGDRAPLLHAVKSPELIRRWRRHFGAEGARDLPACTTRVAIGPTGDVTPWTDVPLTVGNVRQRRFHDIWIASPSPEMVRLRGTTRADLQRMSRCVSPECLRPVGMSAALRRDFRQVVGAACAQCPEQDGMRRRARTDEALTVERVEELASAGRVDEVAEALASGHYVVVRAASDALATIGDEAVVEALDRVFRHDDAEARWAAEMALAPIRTADAVDLMDEVFDKDRRRSGAGVLQPSGVVSPAEPPPTLRRSLRRLTRAAHRVGLGRRDSGIAELLDIPAGRFRMGSPPCEGGHQEDEGLREVTISRPFQIGTTPVTQAQWVEVMGPNDFYFAGHPDRPAERLDWFKAILFCNRLSEVERLQPCYSGARSAVAWDRDADGYRLPTEAEWEYAARAGTTTAYPSGTITHPGAPGEGCLLRRSHERVVREAPAGDAVEDWHVDASGEGEHPHATRQSAADPALDVIGWYRHNSGETTHPVRQKAPNEFGLYDTHGNVFEWVWDWYAPIRAGGHVTDPVGPGAAEGRVLRGGSWYNLPGHCRSAYRYDYTPEVRCFFVGMRVARNR